VLKKMMITDLDGTFLNSSGKVSKKNLYSLDVLGQNGVIRVLATGRSYFSLQHAKFHHLPFDYLIVSSGAAIINNHTNSIVYKCNLTPQESASAFYTLSSLDLDFSIQFAVPDNHFYYYLQKSTSNPDFERRNKIYKNYCFKISPDDFRKNYYSQMIAITDASIGPDYINILKKKLKELKIIRSTSPIDGNSVWIEVFNKNASKLNGIKMLANINKINRHELMCCGNDYNDEEMLEWAKYAYLVDNAPDEMRRKFSTVPSHDHNGFSFAVNKWLNL